MKIPGASERSQGAAKATQAQATPVKGAGVKVAAKPPAGKAPAEAKAKPVVAKPVIGKPVIGKPVIGKPGAAKPAADKAAPVGLPREDVMACHGSELKLRRSLPTMHPCALLARTTPSLSPERSAS